MEHHGSPHVHGLACFPGAPDVQQLLGSPGDCAVSAQKAIIQYMDRIVSTINPVVLPDGTNADTATPPRTNPYICNQSYSEITDFSQNLADLIAACQHHTRCSVTYYLHTDGGVQACCFGYPNPLKPKTTLVMKNNVEPVVLTAHSDSLPVQMSVGHINMDMQYCVSQQKVITYCAKCATMCGRRSQPLKKTSFPPS